MRQTYVSLLLNGKKPLSVSQAARINILLKFSPDKAAAFLDSVMASNGGEEGPLKSRLKRPLPVYHDELGFEEALVHIFLFSFIDGVPGGVFVS